MIRIVLVDDHAMLREGLRSKFDACDDIEVVAEVDSGEGLLDCISTVNPNVVVLDIKLADGNGIQFIAPAQATLPSVRFVILTMYDHPRYAMHALESGADAYVVKGEPFEELEKAVRLVAQGIRFVSPGIAPKLVGRLVNRDQASPIDQLSQREFEVLAMLGNGLPPKEIASAMNVSVKSVATYRSRMLEKLGLDSTADLIRFAMESGIAD